MEQIRVMTVCGTRPEAIKLAPVIKRLEREARIESTLTVTGQHRQLLDQVLALFELEPDYDLAVMKKEQSLSALTSRILTKLGQILNEEEPDLVLVHGDTTTTFVASLAAFYHQIKVGHVEAGLRTYDKYAPYPEEVNRHLTGVLADLHFAPTAKNRANLVAENIAEEQIFVTGNTVIDALLETVDADYQFNNPHLRKLDFSKQVILFTCHRRENFGQPMTDIFKAVRKVVEQNSEVEVVFPVHLNPQVKELAADILQEVERIHLVSPLDYQPFVNLMARSHLIVTDSGGIQEEAPSLNKPVLVLREVTERQEAVETGAIKLIGTTSEQIISQINHLLTDQQQYDQMAQAENPYGDGQASQRIVRKILDLFAN
ncbi:UDP-N-acetylglucosamine 2-epimerase (non-hydrolyzing) [Natroniella sulfidigena]|uniref:non-hydrolyzing UDP-N-acetylglucosamine 2-epimerase n=1 Tax=Natroniella sulfidigena TaxID=723921 RepID=UPI00200B996A|nr:UDP-N-acetylglucosamine 2-epimerase (non-hydrolyzing) [Natroniella sulfidigena]MCK8816272.1 UDP-N-acetylglucosamine 2-epimerase (non-hydrolyzing) [Natroniella sulfidigena]